MNAVAAAVLEGVKGGSPVLEEVRARAVINDLLAEIEVTQRYRNPGANVIEAVYTFPLPLDGVLLGFEFEIGGRRHAGRVVARTEAEDRYEDAITDGDAAVLLEQAGPGLYTASVGNLLPGETATIYFRYGLLLRWNGDNVRFAMPTTIAPRYGDPASAGLRPHQEPGFAFDATREFHASVAVRGMLRDARFNSPSHSVHVSPGSEETIIHLAGAPAMDRDFVLEARASLPDPAGAKAVRDIDGWIALASFRPEVATTMDDRRRSIKILVDCSGSMAGDSIAQARAALERILDGLRKSDQFEVIAFGSGWRGLFGRCVPASEPNLARARRFVRSLDANMGGTEIGGALDAAYGVRGASDSVHDLLLITDGEVWDGKELIDRARRSAHRIFAVGVGSAAAEDFVRRIAETTGGASELVAPREDMADRIHRHFQRMYAPCAKSATVQWPATALRSHPHPIGAVYGGDTVHVFAWFAERPAGRATLEVTLADGRIARQEAEIIALAEHAAETPVSEPALLAPIARIAAARRLCAMADREREAEELAVRYQLMSRWTNCLAIHLREAAGKAEDLPRIVRVPQVIAAGWHGMGSATAPACLSMAPEYVADESGQVLQDQFVQTTRRTGMRLRAAFGGRAPTSISPVDLARLLNKRPLPPFPTLDELIGYGIPEPFATVLRDLAGRSRDELELVVTLLWLLAKSTAGRHLERHTRRPILKAARTRAEPLLPPEDVALVLKGHTGWGSLLRNHGRDGKPSERFLGRS